MEHDKHICKKCICYDCEINDRCLSCQYCGCPDNYKDKPCERLVEWRERHSLDFKIK